MAQPISFRVPPIDSRAALRAKLEQAPDTHADAMLGCVRVFCGPFTNRGILDVTTAALRASDDLIEKAVDSANTPEAIRAIRNLMFWRQVLGRIEPTWFQGIFQAIPDGLATALRAR